LRVGRGRYAAGVYDVSFGRRFLALLIDWGVAMLTVVALTRTPISGDGALSPFWTLLAFVVETALLTGTLGFTIGKRIVGLRVINPAGRVIGLPMALVRSGLLALVLPALVQNEDHRGLHEIASNSRVARAV
jgi:uncharacterized RDD family membrane protein YckC